MADNIIIDMVITAFGTGSISMMLYIVLTTYIIDEE